MTQIHTESPSELNERLMKIVLKLSLSEKIPRGIFSHEALW